jgi:hypothetical protein
MVELRSNERLVEVHWLIETDDRDDEMGVWRFAADDSIPAGAEEDAIRKAAVAYFADDPPRHKPNWGDVNQVPDDFWPAHGLRRLGDVPAVRVEVYHDEELG